MEIEEFIEKHPGFKGKRIQYGHSGIDLLVGAIEDIHETQIDKQKVRDVIDKWVCSSTEWTPEERKRLKKELGLNK